MNSRREVVLSVLPAFIVFALLVPIRCDTCDHDLSSSSSRMGRYFDFRFLGKFFRHMVPFTEPKVKMNFYLYKREFPNCGREIFTDDDDSLALSGFDPQHQTRIMIHGWMSQGKGSFNRAVKGAYMELLKNDTEYDEAGSEFDDLNIIVADWSGVSSNFNYFNVVKMVEDLGSLVAEFTRFLHMKTGAHYDDMYLIGHSLGAQIAGSAGKQVQPFKFNTIFALDPAAPDFREKSDEFRVDPTDAHYVESIQTSTNMGFVEPMGNATFYPNFGTFQKCFTYGCSHKRAYVYFAESITSKKGFWGKLCIRESDHVWECPMTGDEYQMGGEPSTPKAGTFYVKTRSRRPYALGRSEDSQ